MSHSNPLSTRGGLSKALIMTVNLMVCPLPLKQPMCFTECWTPFDVTKVEIRFILIIHALGQIDDFFMVSTHQWNYFPHL